MLLAAMLRERGQEIREADSCQTLLSQKGKARRAASASVDVSSLPLSCPLPCFPCSFESFPSFCAGASRSDDVPVPVALRLGWTESNQSDVATGDEGLTPQSVPLSSCALLPCLLLLLCCCCCCCLPPFASACCPFPPAADGTSARRRARGTEPQGAEHTTAQRAGEAECVEKQTVHEGVRSALNTATCLARLAKLRTGGMRAGRKTESSCCAARLLPLDSARHVHLTVWCWLAPDSPPCPPLR
jgi:hypothetical protein